MKAAIYRKSRHIEVENIPTPKLKKNEVLGADRVFNSSEEDVIS